MKRNTGKLYRRVSKMKRACTIAQLIVVSVAAITQMLIKNFVINVICDPKNASIFTWASNRSDTKEILAFSSGSLIFLASMFIFLNISEYKNSIIKRYVKC